MMRVLGKPDLDNAILFDDLMTLLENYGVQGSKANITNTSLDKSNNKSELPEATGEHIPEDSPEKSPQDMEEKKVADEYVDNLVATAQVKEEVVSAKEEQEQEESKS